MICASLLHYGGFVPPFNCVLGSSIWSCCTDPRGRCAHINKSWPFSSHLTQSFCIYCFLHNHTRTHRNHALSIDETLPFPSIITGSSACRKLWAFLFTSDTSSTVPVRVVLGVGALTFHGILYRKQGDAQQGDRKLHSSRCMHRLCYRSHYC